MNENKSFNHTHFSEVKVRFSFKASPIETAPLGPRLLEHKLRGVQIERTNNHAYLSEVKVRFTFKASPIESAPSTPILLPRKLEEWSINQIKYHQSITLT